MNLHFKIATFYEFKTVDNLQYLSKSLKIFCKTNQLLGTIIIAPEGINGTIAGLSKAINDFANYARTLNFQNLNIKYSKTLNMPFYRNKIKIKKEIVSFLKNPINPNKSKAKSVSAKEWNQLIKQPNVVTIDVRNEYETKIGSFKNAISPKTKSFIEFKKYIETKLIDHKNKKVALYCTGGIRCEKASYYMKKLGFEEVFQLNGGILKYLEDVSDNESLWVGECFVFDNRVTVTSDLNEGNYDLCHGCKEPISYIDQISDKFEKNVSCPNCYEISSENKKNNSRERAKQIELAKKRKTANVYLPKPIEDYK